MCCNWLLAHLHQRPAAQPPQMSASERASLGVGSASPQPAPWEGEARTGPPPSHGEFHVATSKVVEVLAPPPPRV